MCVANLNVALTPCSHRWYTLIRPCSPEANLSNCPQKLRLEGWETRIETCPWCDSCDAQLDDTTHKLFGGSGSRSRANSYGESPASTRRRTSSAATSVLSLSPVGSRDADFETLDELDPGAKAKMMNYRINCYLYRNPDREAWMKKDEEVITAPGEDTSTVSRRGSLIGKKWRKSVRLGRGMFK